MRGGMPKADAFLSRAPSIPVAGAFLGLSLFFIMAGPPRVLTVVPDDAAYYFKIAENASAGKGFSFDGINRTNGFQPLWLYVLVPVYWALHVAPETMCRVILVLQLAFLAGAAMLLKVALARWFADRIVLLSTLIFIFFVLAPGANGMESAILVFFLSLLFNYGAAANVFVRRDTKRELLFGALLGFVVLSRLDTVFLPIVVFAHGAWKVLFDGGGRRAHATRGAAMLGGFAAVVGPYLLYNRLSFGAMMPVSGMLKSSFPHVSLAGRTLSALGRRGWGGFFIAACYFAWIVGRPRTARAADGDRAYLRGAFAMMACAILLHFAHTVLFMKWAVFGWHYASYALFGAVAVCEPAERVFSSVIARRLRVSYVLAVAALVAVGSLAVFRGMTRPSGSAWQIASYDAARWARENTPPETVFAMKDAGFFGYFSDRSVVNLDGVVNNLEYQAVLRERNLHGYLAVKGVGYVVQHAFWDSPDVVSGNYDTYTMSYRSHLYESDSEEMLFRRADEVYRSVPYFDGPYRTVFVIWKIGYGRTTAGSDERDQS